MNTSTIALAELAEKGADVDVLHGVLCAAGFNIRWLLRAIARRGLAAVFFALYGLMLCVLRSCSPPQIGVWTLSALSRVQLIRRSPCRRDCRKV